MRLFVATNQPPPSSGRSGRSRRYHAGPAKISQKRLVYDVIAAAGTDGVSKAEIVSRLAHVPVSEKNIAFYLNKLHKAGIVAVKGEMPADKAALVALSVLEDALVAKAKQHGVSADMDKAFDRYQKIKAHAIRPTGTGEDRAALRLAVLELVKLVF